MQSKYRIKTKIVRKIRIVMILSIICCTLVTSAVTYLYMKPMAMEALLEKKKEMACNLSKQEINTLEEIATYGKNITFDDAIQNFFKRSVEKDSYDYFSGILEVEKRMKEYRMIYGNLIRDIFLMNKEGHAIETVNTYGDLSDIPSFEKMIRQDISGYTTRFVWNYQGVIGEKNTVAYVNSIYDKNSILSEMGKLVILLDIDKMDESLKIDKDICIRLETKEGEVLFNNLEETGKTKEVFTETIGQEAWKIFYTVENHEIENLIKHTSYFMTITIAFFLCGILLLTMFLCIKLMSPLDILIQGMQKSVRENRMVKIQIHTGDECEEAAQVFNQMAESIEERTKQLIESEKRQFELQLKMLSYQINPHFIYNTLNAIICLARKKDHEKIIELTRAFIMLLQSLLRTDLQAMTTVKKEQEYINNYLHVLQICYRNVPDIIWGIQEEVEERRLPKMILYPLVENSVFHGIVPCEHTCFLKISVWEEERRIYVSVEDNGVGCTEKEMREIQQCLQSEKIEKHVGLFNVNGRLKLIYKEYQSLIIQSNPGQGTKIIFSFEDEENIKFDNKMQK